MDANDKQAFAECMQGLASSYRQEIDKPYLQMMFVALSDLTIEQVQHAVIKSMRTCKFMPTAAELRENAIGTGNVHLAWLTLCRTIERFGYHHSVDFEDKAINACVRGLGGWEELCSTPAAEFDRFILPKFERMYKSFSSGPIGEHGGRLIGYFERSNVANGYAADAGGKSKRIAASYETPIGIERQPETFGLDFKPPE